MLPDIFSSERQIELILKYHTGLTNHRGLDETEKQLKQKYYWPNIRTSVQKVLNNCSQCAVVKYDNNP